MTRSRPMRRSLAVLTLALAVSACSSEAETPPGAQDGSAVTGHLHNLAYDGPVLVLGTHYGLWAQEPDAMPFQVSAEPFDVMGLARSGDVWFASGHPAPGMDAPADLGLMASEDSGVTWRSVSLYGEVDFHRLTAAGDVIVGQSAPDQRLLRSEDAGSTWQELGTPPVFDIALNPNDDTEIIATTEQGLLRSADGGRSFTPQPGSPLLMLVAWTQDGIVGVESSGQVHTSADGGDSWGSRGSVPGAPIVLAADGDRIGILVDDAIWESVDGGEAFQVRIAGLGGH